MCPLMTAEKLEVDVADKPKVEVDQFLSDWIGAHHNNSHEALRALALAYMAAENEIASLKNRGYYRHAA